MFNLENKPEEQNLSSGNSLYLVHLFSECRGLTFKFHLWMCKGDFAEPICAFTIIKCKTVFYTFLKRTFCLPGMRLFNKCTIKRIKK